MPLRPSGQVAVAGVVCWWEKNSPDAWLAALAFAVPPTPWMAVSRDPAALAELNAETVLILGDVERCLA